MASKYSQLQVELLAAREEIRNSLDKMFDGKTEFDIIENIDDGDIRVEFHDRNLSSEEITTILKRYEITRIDVDGTSLSLDLKDR